MSYILLRYGGPDGELGASLRYLSQRYSMPYAELKGLLTDIGIEDLFCAFNVKQINPIFSMGFTLEKDEETLKLPRKCKK